MTEQNPAIFLQAGSHPAEDVRRMLEATLAVAGTEGVVDASDMAVTQNGTPNMSVNVAGGRAWIQGDEATYQGAYFVENRGVKNVTISASDPTNPRIDLIVAKVQDSGYSGATDAWSLAAVTGTPAGSPSAPSAPSNSITLAQVAVAASASTIVTANITDTRTVAKTARTVGSSWTNSVTWATENDTTSVPKTATYTAVGTQQTIAKPSGWGTFKVRAVASVGLSALSPNTYLVSATLKIDGTSYTDRIHAIDANAFGNHTANFDVSTGSSATYSADVDFDLEVWNSAASSAAISMATITYDIELIRVT